MVGGAGKALGAVGCSVPHANPSIRPPMSEPQRKTRVMTNSFGEARVTAARVSVSLLAWWLHRVDRYPTEPHARRPPDSGKRCASWLRVSAAVSGYVAEVRAGDWFILH